MGAASAYTAVRSGIDSDLRDLVREYGDHFIFDDISKEVFEIRDFGTTGVVAFARGTPFDGMPTGKFKLGQRRVHVKPEYQDQAVEAVDQITSWKNCNLKWHCP